MAINSEVIFIGGSAGVGKTSVAMELHEQLSRAGVQHCVIEGDNLDLAWPVPHQRGLQLAERHLAFMWHSYQSAGYSRLIYTNTASVQASVLASLLEALGGNPLVHAVLLRAGTASVAKRLTRREIGSGLADHVTHSETSRNALDNAAPGWVLRIDTDGRTVTDIAAEIAGELGWAERDGHGEVGGLAEDHTSRQR
jgi:hypothetical protein